MSDKKVTNQSSNGKLNGSSSTEEKTPFLIGVGGGTASGKVIIAFHFFLPIEKKNYILCLKWFIIIWKLQSTVCKRIMEQLGQADMDHTQRQVFFFKKKNLKCEAMLALYYHPIIFIFFCLRLFGLFIHIFIIFRLFVSVKIVFIVN